MTSLAQVTTADVAAFAPWRVGLKLGRKERIGPASINRDLTQFVTFWHWLQRMEFVAHDPCAKVKKAKEFKGTEEIRIIARERFDAITAELVRREQEHWARACEAMLATGMRWSSLGKLREEHLDEARKVVRLVRPKGKKDVELQITSERGWIALAWCAKDAGFSKDSGSFNKAIRVAGAAAGVPRFTAHMLRHTFAVEQIEAGADVRQLQLWLGHAQLATTERYLRHVRQKAPEALL